MTNILGTPTGPTVKERERAIVLENISFAVVNGHITQAQAEQARAALIAEWSRQDNDTRSR